MWPATPIFELGWAIPVKSHVLKFGLDWLSLWKVTIWIFREGRGRNPIIGVTCDLWCPFSNLAELLQSKVMWKFGLDWLSFSRIIASTNIFLGGRNPLLGTVTFDLRCPFLNSDELFQSNFMCENLVWIDWNRRDVNFEGGGWPPVRGGYMWPAMSIFELGRGFLDKSPVWKFGSDWLRLSRVIVGTNQMDHKRGRTKTTTRTRTKIFKVTCRSSPIGALNNNNGIKLQ